MPEYRATVDGNTYSLRTAGKHEHIIGGSWVKGKAQNLTKPQFAQFLIKMLAKVTAQKQERVP